MQVFRPDRKIPDQIFRDRFQFAFYTFQGIHFDKKFYDKLQGVLQELGEEHFTILGDPGSAPKERADFLYPANLTWGELTEGKGSQYFHLNYSDEYYIIGETGSWGMYSFTVEFGLIIIGYMESVAEAFEHRFISDKSEISHWVSDTLELTEKDFRHRFVENYLS